MDVPQHPSGRDGSRSVAEPVIIGCSAVMQQLREVASRVACADAKVLITGESGAGKDIVARFVHARSPRAGRSFVAVNCAGVSETLLESELFGHVKGSFTGAYRDKIGKLQLAHRGTIFLDEVGEMSPRMQALLLRAVEDGEIQPVGSDVTTSRVDARVIAATNRNLDALVARGEFREDLLYRLKVIHLEVPPLRDRPDDIAPLVTHLAERSGSRRQFSPEAVEVLARYHWPGNVRELQNVVEQTTLMTAGDIVRVEDLPPAVRLATTARVTPARERRHQVADDLYTGLVERRFTFWDHVHPLFLNRDITRHDMNELVRRGLRATQGNYRTLLKLFGMDDRDYKRFHNVLKAHDCGVDFHGFRPGRHDAVDVAGVVSRPPESFSAHA